MGATGEYSDEFPLNAPWALDFMWDDEDGNPVNLSGQTGSQIRIQVQGPGGVITTYAIGTGLTLSSTVVGATAIDGAFLADNVVRAATAKFFTSGVFRNQTVVIAGSGTNDDTLLVSADPAGPPPSTVTAEQGVLSVKKTDGTAHTFNAEPAAGTVTVTDLSRFEWLADPGFPRGTYFYDLWIDLVSVATPVLRGVITVTESNES